jgi:hypothetical protein
MEILYNRKLQFAEFHGRYERVALQWGLTTCSCLLTRKQNIKIADTLFENVVMFTNLGTTLNNQQCMTTKILPD